MDSSIAEKLSVLEEIEKHLEEALNKQNVIESALHFFEQDMFSIEDIWLRSMEQQFVDELYESSPTKMNKYSANLLVEKEAETSTTSGGDHDDWEMNATTKRRVYSFSNSSKTALFAVYKLRRRTLKPITSFLANTANIANGHQHYRLASSSMIAGGNTTVLSTASFRFLPLFEILVSLTYDPERNKENDILRGKIRRIEQRT
ncbi:hypothetical protein GJ496_001491 [Pomphorhynchus laevis]|nr:hypothetical protein GJ496_001491 [Pomphorhynchus laevis]